MGLLESIGCNYWMGLLEQWFVCNYWNLLGVGLGPVGVCTLQKRCVESSLMVWERSFKSGNA